MHEHYEKDGHPPFIIGEAKYGSGKLSMTEDGLQMSESWIFKSGRLEETIGKNLADKLLMGEIEYGKQLFTYSKSGKITISIL